MYEKRWLFIWSDCMWTRFLWKPYHHNAAVTHLLNNLPSLNKQSKHAYTPHPTPPLAPTCVTKVLLPRSKDGDLFQSQTWLRNHCPPEYSDSQLTPSLTACRCRLHMGVEKCENPDVPCGAGVLLSLPVLAQSHATIVVPADETDKNSTLSSYLWPYDKNMHLTHTHTN